MRDEIRVTKVEAAANNRRLKRNQLIAMQSLRVVSPVMFRLQGCMKKPGASRLPENKKPEIKASLDQLKTIDKACQGLLKCVNKGEEVPKCLERDAVKNAVSAASDWAGKISQFCANCALDDKASKRVTPV